MRKPINLLIFIALLLLTLSLFPSNEVSANPHQQAEITTSSQLIDVVNGLRLAYGLPPLAVHSVLMQIAASFIGGGAAVWLIRDPN